MSIRVYSSLEQVRKSPAQGRAVAIGVFDGVHRGHQRILRRAAEEAAATGALATVVTFYPHPEAVLRPGSAPRMLTSVERKGRLLEELGLDEMVVVKFDRDFARLSPESFCSAVLSTRLGARTVFVGENFRFGRGGTGTAERLLEYGRTHGFEVRPVSLVEENGEVISSTRIRESLRDGRVEEAARLLGRPHRLEGEVSSGAGRGRSLEAPTANLIVSRRLALPRLGVYVTRSTVDDDRVYESVTSVGTNPTFESGRKVRIETLLFEFNGDLYGRRLAVDFLVRIRGQKTFGDALSLAERIKRDVEIALAVHAGASLPDAERAVDARTADTHTADTS
ncbi:MAG: bifunctional riboflavin kinase/FAD synthetase [Actinobacteria bacterium]|nr:bifunctional riboflavin kinase/FAD synthetase [Actinomycetota bacterium]